VSSDKAPDASWSVGQLARATGLSVRVVRHWEEMGLLTPERTASGHRRYGPAQVTRLHRAVALRRAGLGLGQIAALLAERDPDPAATLRAHLAQLEEELRRLGELRDRLAAALAAYDGDGDAAALMRVIETMTMFQQYVHGYQAGENLRLHDQASALLDLLHDGTGYPPGSHVLEAGCGVGAQTVTLARRSPGVRVTAIDTSAASLREARQRVQAAGLAGVRFQQADVLSLPEAGAGLGPGTFDHVFVCFLLEHLKSPAEALVRLRAMLRPGGTITVIEGDHGSACFHPDSEAARDAIACQVTLQRHADGDAMTGRRLYPLLAGAGYRDIAVSPRVVYADGGHPGLADAFIRKTFTPMIEGVREAAVASGLIDPARFDAGIRDLYRTAEPDGVFCYTFFKAIARTT
jgi:DNA-binding transcriptional MerR regulator/trans-aconitate methyltransferase